MSTENDNTLGEIIKKDIEATGMTFAAVAKKMGVSRQAIFKVDKRKSFDLEFLQKLREATGIDYTNYIFNPKNKRYEPSTRTGLLREPEPSYKKTSDTIEISLSIKINADQESLGRLSDLISSFKGEANKYGFTLK